MAHVLVSSLTSLHSPASAAAPLLVRDEGGAYRRADAAEVLHAAQCLLAQQLRSHPGEDVLRSPGAVKAFLRLRLGTLPHEVFAVIHLDAQHQLIDYVELFRGTVAQTSVYPREIVKDALARNSAALILVHNHPSGATGPSPSDQALTATLRNALALVDVRVIDHLIVAGPNVLSFAERGLL